MLMLKRVCLSVLTWLGVTTKPDVVGELVKVNPANEAVPSGRVVVVWWARIPEMGLYSMPVPLRRRDHALASEIAPSALDGENGLAKPPEH